MFLVIFFKNCRSAGVVPEFANLGAYFSFSRYLMSMNEPKALTTFNGTFTRFGVFVNLATEMGACCILECMDAESLLRDKSEMGGWTFWNHYCNAVNFCNHMDIQHHSCLGRKHHNIRSHKWHLLCSKTYWQIKLNSSVVFHPVRGRNMVPGFRISWVQDWCIVSTPPSMCYFTLPMQVFFLSAQAVTLPNFRCADHLLFYPFSPLGAFLWSYFILFLKQDIYHKICQPRWTPS